MTGNKRYYWLRLKNNFFKQKEFKKLRRIAGGDTYTVIYLKLQNLSLNTDGKLYFDGVEDTFVKNKGIKVIYMPYRDVIISIKQNLIDEENYLKKISKYKTCELLLVDNLFPNNLKNRRYTEDLTTFLTNDVTLVHHVFSINVNEGVKIYQIDLTSFNIDGPNPIVVGLNRISDVGDSVDVSILSTSVNNKMLYLKLKKDGTDNVVGTYGLTMLCYKNY